MKLGGKGSGGKDFPQPETGKQTAVAAALYDIGLQENTWQGETTQSRMCALVWECSETKQDGTPHVVVDKLPQSMWKSSKLRQAAEALLDRSVSEDEEIESTDLIGLGARIEIISGKGDRGSKQRYVAKREGLASQEGVPAIVGKYGEADEIPYLVAYMMRAAEDGTVPSGQGVMPKKKTAKASHSEPESDPVTDGSGAEEGDDF